MRRLALSLGFALACGSVVHAKSQVHTPATPASPDWSAALREDAQEIHDIIAGSHPGPVDPENPAFRDLLEQGLETALRRAKDARTYEDWYFALGQYAASFNDAHLSLSQFSANPNPWRLYWPGFLTIQQGEAHRVSYIRDVSAPPLGAELVSCDGRSAEAFAAEFVGAGVGRWNLKARREIFSNTLFVDQTNPYVRRASTCILKVNGVEQSFDLQWRPLSNEERDEGLAAGRNLPFAPPVGIRAYGEDGVWISMSSFDATRGSSSETALTALTETVTGQADDLRTKQIIVFDLRGNQGGSSIWISQMARVLWGDDWVAWRQIRSQGADWRASQENLDEISSYRTQMADNPTLLAWVNAVAGGLTGARASGTALWLQASGDIRPSSAATTAMHARTYVLTDYGCVSACLDAVDLLTALGARHVGQETSADSLYMNAREQKLTSGRAAVVVPMKVYRGRQRGNNETAIPSAVWTGALADTEGLEAWIAELDRGR